jgi:acetolactate synthase-1/3 small subunit
MLHTLVATVENKPGVLNRVASLLRRRNFNISSLTVGETENPAISRMTIVVDTATTKPHIVSANLYKLVNVIEVRDITTHNRVERDLALLKVRADATSRPEIMQFTELYRAKIVAVAHDALVLEMTGTPQEVGAFIEIIQPFGLLEMTRTGVVAMQYGTHDPATRQPTPAATTNGTKKSAHYVQPLAEREGV